MKILFVTLNSIEMNTSAMIRNRALINGLIENGNKVDILTISSEKNNPYYDDSIEWNENIKVIRLKENVLYKSIVNNTKNSLIDKIKQKLLPFIRFIYHSLNVFDNTISIAKKVNKEILPCYFYDVIISSSDPKSSHIAVKQLIKTGLKYDKWIQYWGDPLAIDITNKTIYPKYILKLLEKRILLGTDKIVYVSPFTLEGQRMLYPQYKNKMDFLPIPYIKRKKYKIREFDLKNVKLGYFGDYHSNIRNISHLYNICKKEEISLIVAGNSDLSLEETKNIKLLPRVSQHKIAELEEQVDILVCILNCRGTQIPGKIYHYASTNKPILLIIDGDKQKEMRDYLAKFERFIICDNNELSIQNALTNVVNNSKEYIPSPYFDSKIIAKKFLK